MMNSFLERLMKEHQHGLATLSILDDAANRLQSSGYVEEDYNRIRSAVDFIDNDIRTHNEREEEYLFPEMERVLPPGGPTGVMRSEHRMLWEALENLNRSLENISSESPGEKFEEIYENSRQIVSLLRNHIQKEDSILFPMAERTLSPEQLTRLENADKELFPNG